MADVQKALDDGVFAVLKADSPLRPYGIYNTSVPEWVDRDLPVIVFQLMDAPVESTFGSRGFLCEVMVKAISRSPWPKEASTISSLIDTVMEDASLTVSGFTHLWSVRNGSIYFQEQINGINFVHSGGIWEMWEAA